jgi:hypothetical protein
MIQLFHNKAELSQEGISFCTQFPSLGVLINKKLENEKNKTTYYPTFKTDKSGLSFFRFPTFY